MTSNRMGTNTMIPKMMRTALVIFATLALAAVPAIAQDQELAPEHLALARKYVDLTDKSNVYEVTLVSTAVETMNTLRRQDPNITEAADKAIENTLAVYREQKSDLFNQFARVYALNFSVEELEQIVAFYESTAGQKLVTANATVNPTIQEVMRIFEANLKVEFFAKVRAELRAAGHDL